MARERKYSTEELFNATKHILLQYGYEGFTFSLLANQLEISRGTLYKYFENKEELITDFMLYEMNLFLTELEGIHTYQHFEEQFDFLIQLMFKNPDIQQLIEMGQHVPIHTNKKVRENKERLSELHLKMYESLQGFIQLGRKEEKLNPKVIDAVILGYIFQAIAIPNHFGIPYSDWIKSIKEMISFGMFNQHINN